MTVVEAGAREEEPPRERTIARMHAHAWRLILPGAVFIAAAAAVGLSSAAITDPARQPQFAVLVAAIAAGLLLGVVPLWLWSRRSATVTDRRIVTRRGVFTAETREMAMSSVVDVAVRRNPLQAFVGAGTVVVTGFNGQVVKLGDIPNAATTADAVRALASAAQPRGASASGPVFGQAPARGQGSADPYGTASSSPTAHASGGQSARGYDDIDDLFS